MRSSHIYIVALVLLCALSMGAFPRQVDPDSVAVPSGPLPAVTDSAESMSARPHSDSLSRLLQRRMTASPDTELQSSSRSAVMDRTLLPADSAQYPDSASAIAGDSLGYAADSATSVINRHTYVADTTRRRRLSRTRIAPPEKGSRIVRSKVDLDNAVDFSAKDSLVLYGRNNAYMYGSSKVEYGTLKLDAQEIQMNLDNSTVYAIGGIDSIGDAFGTPVFEDNGTSYESETMRYNFKTEQGFITNVKTQQGEGYVVGGQTKKVGEDTYYTQNAKYTTCDDHDHPHFYLQMTKAKMRPGKDVVSGPAYMVLAGLPLPLAVPFGYFPFSEKYSSGIIFPSFGDDYNRGYYLSNGGYYFAISDNMDLALTGEIYTLGSWGLRANSAYVKRYKYSGNFNISYLQTVTGDKGMPDYSKSTNFQVLWSHSQDSKANPNMSLSASVNFTTSGYTRNDLNSYYSNDFTQNTKSSTVNMTYRFPNSKWSLSTTANVSQRSQDSTLAVSFPNFTLTMSQVYPFKRKRAVGEEKWYEKIKLSYSGQFNNSLTAKQDEFFKKSLVKDWRNGMRHSIPVSATFNLFKYLNLTPSINLTDRMYTTKVRRQWDPNASAEVLDTTYSFYNVWDFNAAVALDTKIFGCLQPLRFLGG
ncbi:putative LPS assembly protein LptD [Duncaniella dubosii]|uniref:putative LPS assembly protein LptD n=1 Tax=Duncaniella dubosii TaxID=2518971 RepID=UPI003528F5D5